MGLAVREFEWISIGPGETVAVWIHGYSINEFVTYCITAEQHSNEPSGSTDVKATMSIDKTGPHVDGSVGRTVLVTNNSVGPQAYISCTLNAFVERIG